MSKWTLRGEFASEKMGRLIPYSTSILKDYLALLEFDPAVRAYMALEDEEMPESIPAVLSALVPSIVVLRDSDRCLITVVEQPDLDDFILDQFSEGMREMVGAHGYSWELVTRADLEVNYLAKNVEYLHRFARYSIDDRQKETVLACFRQNLEVTLADLACALAPRDPQSALIPILKLVWDHQIVLPLCDLPIGPDTPARLP